MLFAVGDSNCRRLLDDPATDGLMESCSKLNANNTYVAAAGGARPQDTLTPSGKCQIYVPPGVHDFGAIWFSNGAYDEARPEYLNGLRLLTQSLKKRVGFLFIVLPLKGSGEPRGTGIYEAIAGVLSPMKRIQIIDPFHLRWQLQLSHRSYYDRRSSIHLSRLGYGAVLNALDQAMAEKETESRIAVARLVEGYRRKHTSRTPVSMIPRVWREKIRTNGGPKGTLHTLLWGQACRRPGQMQHIFAENATPSERNYFDRVGGLQHEPGLAQMRRRWYQMI